MLLNLAKPRDIYNRPVLTGPIQLALKLIDWQGCSTLRTVIGRIVSKAPAAFARRIVFRHALVVLARVRIAHEPQELEERNEEEIRRPQ